MSIVRFNYPEEFIGEMEKDAPLVERGIIRLTKRWQPSSDSRNIRLLSVVATAVVGGNLIRLEHSFWGIYKSDENTEVKADKVIKRLRDGCSRLGLEIREGMFEEATV